MNRVGLVVASCTGGMGAHVRSLALLLPAHGWEVTVAAPVAAEAQFRFCDAGARFVALTGPGSLLRAWRPLSARAGTVDLLHAHGLRAALVGAALGGPLVATWHNGPEPAPARGRRARELAERVVARRSDVTLAASHDLAARARACGGADVREFAVTLAPRLPVRTAQQVRTELGMSPRQRLVVTVARLHRQKALDVLIEAACGWPGVLVAIAGDGPLRRQLQKHVDAAGAPVRLLGHRTDVADLLAAADLAVLPSRWEARSLFAQEALLAGTPLLATAVGGLPSLLGDGARMVAPGDVAALRTAGAQLLADERARQSLRRRGSAVAAGWPSEPAAVAAVAAVYRSLICR